jgi:outer membrane immunogenic protein
MGVCDMRKKLLFSAAVFIAAISTASAADLRPMYTKAPPPAPVIFSWTGFYVGLNAGGKWITNSDETVTVGGTTFTLGGNNDSSWIAGGQVGYNWQAPGSLWVFGIEGDIDAQDFHRDRVLGTAIGPFIPGDAFSFESKWQASIRGRIGYAAWDRALLYVTGGVAFTQLKGSAALVGLGVVTDDQTIVGGTVGAGLEYAFTNNISLGIEGRYTFYGDQDFNVGNVPVGVVATAIGDRMSLNTAEVMGKINFRFW